MLYNKLYGKITWKRTHTLMQWTWTWTNFGRWWRTGRAGVLQSLGLQRVGHDWVTEQQDTFMRKWITLLNTSKKKNKHAVQHRKSPLCYAVLSCSVMSNSLWPMAPPGSSVHGGFPGKNTGVGCYALFQGMFPTQGSNPYLPHCRQILYQLSYQGNPSHLYTDIK